MIINFNCKNTENQTIPFKVWFNQVPFEPEEALYYIAIFYDKDGNEIDEYCEISPALCLAKIKDFLNGYHYKIQDVNFNKLPEPQNLFGELLANFGQ